MVVDKSEEEIATPGDVALSNLSLPLFVSCVDTKQSSNSVRAVLEDCLKKLNLRPDYSWTPSLGGPRDYSGRRT